MATQPTAKEEREHRETEKPDKLPLIVVELRKRRPPEQVRRLRKGRGKLVMDIDEVMDELVEEGTVKSGTQPVVIIVREAVPLLWALDYDDEDDDDDDDDDEDDED
jgi:hypothetical protein